MNKLFPVLNIVFGLMLVSGLLNIADAQKRINKIYPKFEWTSPSLTGISLWRNYSGEWEEKIFAASDTNQSPCNTEPGMRLHSAKISVEDQQYFVLFFTICEGFYEYRHIKEGYHSSGQLYLLVYTSKRFEKLASLVRDLKSRDRAFPTFIFGSLSMALTGGENGENLNYDYIAEVASKAIESESPTSTISRFIAINSQIIDGESIVRFNLPPDVRKPKIDKRYFECSLSEFEVIFPDTF